MTTINNLYSDIQPNLEMTYNRDIQKTVGVRSVKDSIIGIVTTEKGTRPFDPLFGCNIVNQLFENMNPLTKDSMIKEITYAIRNYEPRVSKLKMDIQANYDSYEALVTIFFSIVDNPDVLEKIKLQLSKKNN